METNLEEINKIEKRISNNTETKEDYSLLDDMIHQITGEHYYILKQLKNHNITNYELYRIGKNIDGIIYGNILGIISTLKKYLKNELK